MKMLQAGGEGGDYYAEMFTLNLIRGRVFKSIILFKFKKYRICFIKGKLAIHKIKRRSLRVTMLLRQTYFDATCLAHDGN